MGVKGGRTKEWEMMRGRAGEALEGLMKGSCVRQSERGECMERQGVRYEGKRKKAEKGLVMILAAGTVK